MNRCNTVSSVNQAAAPDLSLPPGEQQVDMFIPQHWPGYNSPEQTSLAKRDLRPVIMRSTPLGSHDLPFLATTVAVHIAPFWTFFANNLQLSGCETDWIEHDNNNFDVDCCNAMLATVIKNYGLTIDQIIDIGTDIIERFTNESPRDPLLSNMFQELASLKEFIGALNIIYPKTQDLPSIRQPINIAPIETNQTFPLNTDTLNFSDHFEILLKATRELIPHWKKIAYRLIPFSDVERISQNHKNDARTSLEEALKTWLSKGEKDKCTLQHLVDILHTTGLNDVITHIKEQYHYGDIKPKLVKFPLPLVEQKLTTDHFPALLQYVIPNMATKWAQVAPYLLPLHDIEAITENHSDVRVSCEAMFIQWIHNGNASMDHLINTLKFLKYNTLAKELENVCEST